ncbi:flagellar protein FlgN [Heliophilum fasciatum]|uniref:FlgN protein n=1 Tax=Heliophilum fasciatum TaxID=35700 RepID=A0A4R2RJQ3_9FIRM|nr:flagellar protein FlgN [Heliophilum fasciatum]MCW2278822.1 flagellar biosynthesis/type III secretory pathway chaperone [Heliophilum fasciatum]TCP64092.1 FlgN protein [Heliophilum fasciatum]
MRTQVPSATSDLADATWEDLFERLNQSLSMHADLLQAMVHLAELQEKALFRASLEEIKKITAAQEILVARAGKVEEQRQRYTAHLVRFPRFADCQTLAQIVAVAPPDRKTALETCMGQLQQQTKILREKTARNEEMLQQTLKFFQHFMNTMCAATEAPTAGYGRGGDMSGEQRAFFSKRI